jgi:hypothetical protein
MTDLEANPSVKAVVFQSANPDFFIAHLDVSKAAEPPGLLDLWRDFVLRLSSTPVVSIAKIRGRTRGIGNEFVLACDMRLRQPATRPIRATRAGAFQDPVVFPLEGDALVIACDQPERRPARAVGAQLIRSSFCRRRAASKPGRG